MAALLDAPEPAPTPAAPVRLPIGRRPETRPPAAPEPTAAPRSLAGPDRPAYRGGATTYAFEHRATARLPNRARTAVEAVGLAALATALWVAALPAVSRLWGRALAALADALGGSFSVVMSVHDVFGWAEVGVAHLAAAPPLPSQTALVASGAGVLVLAAASALLSERWRPGVYLLRAALLVHASAVAVFALAPETFPYTLADYLHGMTATGLAITTAVPVVFGLTYSIQEATLAQKAALTALALGYSVVLVPLQYAAQAVVLSAGSVLWMPVLYLVLGVPLHVFALVALYAWGMSWPLPGVPLGVPALPRPALSGPFAP